MQHAIPETVYQKLIEKMNEAVLLRDKNDKVLYVNPKFSDLTGYDLGDINRCDDFSLWDKKSTEFVQKIAVNERERGISSSYEAHLVTKQGKRIPVLVSGTPLPEGGSMALIADLRQIKEKETLYRKLVEHMNEAVWMGDKNERTIYANPKFCELMEYSLGEMLGRESYDFWDKESAEVVRNVNQTKRKRGMSSGYTGNLLTKTGKKVPVLLSGTPLENGGTIGIMTDLRLLKEKEEVERILGNAIQHASDAIVIFDSNGKITSWNKGAKVIFGYKKDEIIGSELKSIFPLEDIDLMIKNSRKLQKIELSGVHRNNRTLKIAATFTPIYKKGSRVISSYLIIGRDIIEQVKFEEEIAVKYKKIRQAYSQLGTVKRQMDYLLDLLELCNTSNDKKNIADFIVTSVIMLTRVDACVLRSFDTEKKDLKLLSSFGVDNDWRGKAVIPFKDSLVEKAYKNRASLRLIDISKENKHQSVYLAKKNNLSSLLLIPLIYESKLVGSLSLYANPNKKLEIFENEFIEKYAKLISFVVKKEF